MLVINKSFFNSTVLKTFAQYSASRSKCRVHDSIHRRLGHNRAFYVKTIEGPLCLNQSRIKPYVSSYVLAKNYSTSKEQNVNNSKENPDSKTNYNKKNLIISLVVLATSIVGVYSALNYGKKEEKKTEPVKKVKKEKRTAVRAPLVSSDIPEHVPYLLIGGGTASFSAFRAIKSSDPTAKVLVVSNEGNYPYMRPPLSKEIWYNDDRQLMKSLKFKQWNGSERSLFYEPEDFYVDCKELPNVPNGGVAVARGWNIIKLNPVKRSATLDDGKEITYDKCLIATGASPKNLKVFENPDLKDKITLFRTIYDFEALEEICNQAKSVVVVGGGFLGSEISCALARYGKNKSLNVKQIFGEKGNMAKVLPAYLSEWTTTKVQSEGVEVLSNVEVVSAELGEANKLVLSLKDGSKVEADHVIVCAGVQPNTDLAETSELEVDQELGGFLVNAELEARSNLYVAGDCACFYDTKLGRRRVEHHDHAVLSGRLAGENMTGAHKPYIHQSMFWSDLGPEIGYEAIGIVDSKLPTYAVFATQDKINNKLENMSVNDAEDEAASTKAVSESTDQSADKNNYSKGLIFYLKNNVVVGIVLWNVFNRMSTARQIIKEHRQFEDLNEVAKLFKIYED